MSVFFTDFQKSVPIENPHLMENNSGENDTTEQNQFVWIFSFFQNDIRHNISNIQKLRKSFSMSLKILKLVAAYKNKVS